MKLQNADDGAVMGPSEVSTDSDPVEDSGLGDADGGLGEWFDLVEKDLMDENIESLLAALKCHNGEQLGEGNSS